MSERPNRLVLSITGTLILLLVIGNIAAHPHPNDRATLPTRSIPPAKAQTVSASAEPAPPLPPRPTPRSEIQGQDHYYYTRRFRDYERQQQLRRPAFQHLPYRTSQAHIDITDVTSDGRVVLTVIPLGLNVNPKVEYHKFLARYHDPGAAYLAVFARYGK